MNSSSGGEATANSEVRAVPYAVKSPFAPFLLIQGQPQGNLNAVKMPTTNTGIYPRAAPVRVAPAPTSAAHNTAAAAFIQQNSNRSLLNKPSNSTNNKNNQTIYVANSAEQLRQVPASMLMASGTTKKQLIMIGNVNNQLPGNVKVIGHTKVNNKGNGSESPNHEQQNVMLLQTTTANVTPNATYILSKGAKPQKFVYAPIAPTPGNKVQVVLTTEGPMQMTPTKPNISLVEHLSHPETVTINLPSPLAADVVSEDSCSELVSLTKEEQRKEYHPKKTIKKPEEFSVSRLQGTSLGQIVSSNPSGSITNFQISNGQIITEQITQEPEEELQSLQHAKMLSLVNYEIEILGPEPEPVMVPEPPKKEEVKPVDDEIQITKVVVEEKPQPQPPPVKREATKNRRKQSLSVKTDAIPVREEPKPKIIEVNHKSERLSVESEENDKSDAENFDPLKFLDWNDNVGTLPYSDLKFRFNEFGLIEILDEAEEEEGKISSKSSTVSDPDKTEKQKKSRNLDEILCCHSCGTYGMGCEFVSSRFCSVACSKAYAEEKAQSAKKLQEKQDKKMKLKQQKILLLQQREKLEKLGLLEAKVAIEEKLKMLRMERELMRTNTADSDREGSADRVRNSSRNAFSWTKYLTMLKAKSAPYTLFKDAFPTGKNNFKIGMKLEGIDPIHPSLFCVLTVSAVRGYRIKLHFDGYPDCHDFWVNANSGDIFHAGWCERTNHKLSAPKGYGEKSFNWGNYLRMTRTVAAPKTCFVNNQEKTIIPSGFRPGMKLEAVDKKNSSLVCVATIADVLDNRILVHFDSWDDIYDYWVDHTSPYIHPVGWCKENGHQLTPPNDYKSPSAFSWDTYLRETKCLPAPARAFKPRSTTEFRRGMKLECVDKRNPILIRVATIVDIVAQQLKIKFDGWPDQYAYWVDDDCPDIHPAGWCQKTSHPLEPPPCEEDIKNTSICPTPGCRGIGHVKGKHTVHHMVLSCPYSSMNYLRDDHIPDRFLSKREYYEVKETSLSKGTKPRPGVPRKPRIEEPVSPPPKLETRGRKRKVEKDGFKDREYLPPNSKKKGKSSGQEENADGSENEPPLWSKNSWDISETVDSIGSNPLTWTPSQVSTFVENINNSEEKGKLFTEHQIDGEALLMLSQNDLVQILGFKLGPAIKLYKSIVLLRQKALEIKKKASS